MRRLHLLRDQLPLDGILRALLTFLALADAALSLELWVLKHREARALAGAVQGAVSSLGFLAAIAMAAAALYLATRPKQAFQRILVVLTVVAGVLSVTAGQPALIVLAALVGLTVILAPSLWSEVGDPFSSRLGWSLLGAAALAVSGTVWVVLQHHRDHRFAAVVPMLLVTAFLAVLAGLALLDRNPRMPRRSDPLGAVALFRTAGWSGVSPFALMKDKRHFWAAAHDAFVAYGCRTGVALALGPAIGEAQAATRAAEEFRATCRRRGWRPAFYQVPEATADALPGTSRLLIGTEAMLDVDRFGLSGGTMKNLRTMVTKARRSEVGVELQAEADLTDETRATMRDLASEIRSRRWFGEMRFSVGSTEDPTDVERTVGLAYDPGGHLVAYVTWLWAPAAATMVLDEFKRGPHAPSGTMEMLIATSLLEFKGRARRASLGLAPITGRMSSGLHRFKAKFDPTWEPRYLLVERLADLPAVLLATLLLHYPQRGLASALRGRLSARPAGPRTV